MLRNLKNALRQTFLYPYYAHYQSRKALWKRMLGSMRGVTGRDQAAMALSAVIDVVDYTLHPRLNRNPLCRFACQVYLPEFDVVFFIRKGSDDLYTVLPHRERDVHDSILGPLGAGDTFLDVGANIGYYTILAAKRVGPRGKVIAVEAFPPTAEQLHKNLAANDVENVEVVQAAVWNEAGQELNFSYTNGLWGCVKTIDEQDHSGVRHPPVMTELIDNICQNYGAIKLIKLDIEGSDYPALLGAQKTLDRVANVVAECMDNRDQTIRLLESRGFCIAKQGFSTYISAQRSA